MLKLLILYITILYCFLPPTTCQKSRRQLIRPKETILTEVEFEPGIHDVLTASTPPQTTVTTTTPGYDDSTMLSIQRVARNRLGKRQGSNRRSSSGTSDSNNEGIRQRLDSIILLISRMGDRMVAMETVQTQWKERIDNIQYRLTKMELMDEERKGQLTEVAGSVRHRLQSTDRELEQLHNAIEVIKTSIGVIDEKGTQIKNSIDAIQPDNGKPKLQAILAAVFGVKNDIQKLSKDLDISKLAVTSIQNTTKHLSSLSSTLVTKSYLHKTMVDHHTTSLNNGMYPVPIQVAVPRKSQASKKSDPQDCWEIIKKRGQKKSGVYRIQPLSAPEPFFVYCDMETAGGGWTVIQRRHDGSVDFAREWIDYKHGFGNLAGEFWLGNEKIHQLTNHHVSELEISLADFDQQKGTAHYSAFAMGNEAEGYALKLLGHYDGDAGDSLLYHVGQRWSTIDSDSDAYPERNCARDHIGAWWYKACDTSNLNGRYLHGPVPLEHEYKGVYWYDFRGPLYSLWKTTMMVRRGGSVKEPVLAPTPTVPSTTRAPINTRNNTTTEKERFNPDYDPYVIYEHGYDHMG